MIGAPVTRLTTPVELPDAELWLVKLARYAEDADFSMLSNDEQARASRFVLPLDRLHYLTAHRALRETLSNCTGILPNALKFTVGPHGKPALADVKHCHFNLSHSAGLALIGVSREAEIGVDIEVLDQRNNINAMADMVLTQPEQLALQRLPASEQQRAFLTCWTRKEACLKALGTGLTVSPNCIEVGIHDTPLLLPARPSLTAQNLRIVSFIHEPGFVAALAQVLSA